MFIWFFVKCIFVILFFFFFNDTATTEIYTLSLHDALPIYLKNPSLKCEISMPVVTAALTHGLSLVHSLFVEYGDTLILPDMVWGNYKKVFYNAKFDRSEEHTSELQSHSFISYAVFCLKKKN